MVVQDGVMICSKMKMKMEMEMHALL